MISATFGWPPKRKLGHGCHKVLTIKMLACRSIPPDGVTEWGIAWNVTAIVRAMPMLSGWSVAQFQLQCGVGVA